MGLARFIARQLGRPSRLTGRLLNLANARANDQAIELLDVSSESRVLDVGFGGGVALAKLAGRVALAAGLDHSEASVRAARKCFRGEIESNRMQIEAGKADAMPFADASFDRVLTVHTIYFWVDPERELKEIMRVLRPGGRLVLGTDKRGTPRSIAKHGFTTYTEDQQEALLRSAGFAAVRFEHRDPLLFAVAAKAAG